MAYIKLLALILLAAILKIFLFKEYELISILNYVILISLFTTIEGKNE